MSGRDTGDDELEIVDLVWEDERGRPRGPAPPPPARAAGLRAPIRRWLVVVAVLVVAIGAASYVSARRNHGSPDAARHASTATGSARPLPELGGAPLLGQRSGRYVVSINGEIAIVDAGRRKIISPARTPAAPARVAGVVGESVLVTSLGKPDELIHGDGSTMRVERDASVFPAIDERGWWQASDGVMLHVGDVVPSTLYPIATSPVAELRKGLLLVTEEPTRLVVWRPGQNPAALPDFLPSWAGVIAADRTHVAYLSCPPTAGACFAYIRSTQTGRDVTIDLPQRHYADTGRFSPDGSRLALSVVTPTDSVVDLVDTFNGHLVTEVSEYPLESSIEEAPALIRPVVFTWTADGRGLLVVQGRPDRTARTLATFAAADGDFERSVPVQGLEQIASLDVGRVTDERSIQIAP